MRLRLRTLWLTGLAALVAWPAYHGDSVADEPAVRLAATPAAEDVPRTLPTSTVMHAKMVCTQEILAGLLSEDYAQIKSSADQLLALARDVPARKSDDVIDDAVYEHFRYELLRLSAELHEMGEQRNLSGAAYVHNNLTAACIGCHQHLRQESSSIELMSSPRAIHRKTRGPLLRPIPVTGGDR